MSLRDLAMALLAERFTPLPEHNADQPNDEPAVCATRRARLLAATRNDDRKGER